MRWLIDGYNVIRRDPELRDRETVSLEAGRAMLLALVARVAARVSDNFTVVFDGARRTGGEPALGGRVQVTFSRPPETADDVLRRLAGTLREGAVVVTSDRAVQDSARRSGSVAVSAEAFLRALAGPTDDDDDDDIPGERRGPSRRPSREARDAERVLRRLRER